LPTIFFSSRLSFHRLFFRLPRLRAAGIPKTGRTLDSPVSSCPGFGNTLRISRSWFFGSVSSTTVTLFRSTSTFFFFGTRLRHSSLALSSFTFFPPSSGLFFGSISSFLCPLRLSTFVPPTAVTLGELTLVSYTTNGLPPDLAGLLPPPPFLLTPFLFHLGPGLGIYLGRRQKY